MDGKGDYMIGSLIGKGSSAVVYNGLDPKNQKPIALKMIRTKNMTGSKLERVHREIEALQALDHEHIIKLYDVIEFRGRLCLVLELADNGDLCEYVMNNGQLSREETLRIVAQLVQALEHCHSRGVCHRDLKLENIIFDSDRNVKITDFGLCHNDLSSCHSLSTTCGSPNYVSPEVVSGKKYDGRLADIWSLGVCTYMMVTGGAPFFGERTESLLQNVCKGSFEMPDFVDSDIADLIKSMMKKNPLKRISLERIKQHSCFSEGKHFKKSLSISLPRTPSTLKLCTDTCPSTPVGPQTPESYSCSPTSLAAAARFPHSPIISPLSPVTPFFPSLPPIADVPYERSEAAAELGETKEESDAKEGETQDRHETHIEEVRADAVETSSIFSRIAKDTSAGVFTTLSAEATTDAEAGAVSTVSTGSTGSGPTGSGPTGPATGCDVVETSSMHSRLEAPTAIEMAEAVTETEVGPTFDSLGSKMRPRCSDADAATSSRGFLPTSPPAAVSRQAGVTGDPTNS